MTAGKLSVVLIVALMVLAPLSVPAQYGDDGEEAGKENGDADPAGQQANETRDNATDDAAGPPTLNVTDGFNAQVVASGLNYPTSIDWDENGTAYLALAGFVYGINESQPGQVLQQQANGSWTTIADGFDPPVNDLTWHEGDLYVSARGSIVRLDGDANWTNETVVEDLPSFGDHHNNEIVFGPDGRLYVGQGTATNAAVVGLDNLAWPGNLTDGHDIPCEDLTLTGVNYVTDNPFQDGVNETEVRRVTFNSSSEVPDDAEGLEGANATTGPYHPFGAPTYEGDVVEGAMPCSGAILSMEPNGTDLDWYAWGLRNPYSLAFDGQGQLWVAENQVDDRGSRPVANVFDYFWAIQEGQWYGWPDFVGGVPVDQAFFAPPNGTAPAPVLQDPPSSSPPAPTVDLPAHSAATKFDLSPGDPWGDNGTVYMALFGDMTPITGTVEEPAGMSVVRFNASGDDGIETFLSREGGPTGEFRPVEAVFGDDGNLYVVHIGTLVVDGDPPAAPIPSANTGAVYVVSPAENVTEEDPPGNETPEPGTDDDPGDGLGGDLGGIVHEGDGGASDNDTANDTDNDTDDEGPVEGPEDTPALGALVALSVVAAVAALTARREA